MHDSCPSSPKLNIVENKNNLKPPSSIKVETLDQGVIISQEFRKSRNNSKTKRSNSRSKRNHERPASMNANLEDRRIFLSSLPRSSSSGVPPIRVDIVEFVTCSLQNKKNKPIYELDNQQIEITIIHLISHILIVA